MKKIIALICILGCIGMLVGCGCNTEKTDDATTTAQNGDISNAPTDSTETQKPQKKTEKVTAAPTKKPTEKPTQKPTKKINKKKSSKNVVRDIYGSWAWEGGVFVYTFNKDGTGVYTTGSEALYFNYKDTGKTLKIKYKDQKKPNEYKYRLKGNKLIIKDDNGDDVIYIKSKSRKK